ncbi:MAG TPA: hypothetical protein VFC14_13860 [Burkholderiales bacterium]|nr:hypothetical protein [Burkholderiales bacterium]
MDIDIGEIASTVRTVDGSSLLAPELMERIVRAVLLALEEKQTRDARVRAERRITDGVSAERDAEGGL